MIRASLAFLVLVLASSFAAAQTKILYHPLHPPPAQDVLRTLRIASFAGTSQDSIQATATDSSGNIYVTGTTNSAQFPVKNAEQPLFGETSILRTTDLGVTWTRVGYPPGGASALAADPVTPQVIFASGPNGIFKSTDSGQTWQSVYPFTPSFSTGLPLAIDPGNHLYIAALTPAGTLIRSVDGGATWSVGGAVCGTSPCDVELPAELIADPTGSGTLLVLSLGSISISRDWGVTFQALPGFGPSAAAFDPSHPGWIYVAYSAGVSGSVYQTTDYGETWTQKASPPGTFSAITAIAVDPDQPSTLVALALGGIYTSTDGASSWTLKKSTSNFSPNTSPIGFNTFLLVPESCNASGGLFTLGDASPGSFGVAFSPDFGVTWITPQLTGVSSVTAGAGCTFYVTRSLTSDAFVAKVAPDGATLWATFLGGSDRDAPVALAVDAQDNVYVTGNTSSPDFPASVPHIGPRGVNSVFLTKFSADGATIYSAIFGGEADNTAIGLAVDTSQSAYIAGITDSLQFPATPGTIIASLSQDSYTGFLAKLSSNATLSYATYLGMSYTYPGAILVDASENVIVAGTGMLPGSSAPAGSAPEFVMKLNPAASQVLASAYLPASETSDGAGVTGLVIDSQNNLMVFGQTENGSLQATAGAYVSPQPSTGCEFYPGSRLAGDAYVMKLSAADLQPAYIAVFTAPCGIETGGIALDGTGASVLTMAANSGLSLRSPLVGGPACNPYSSAIAKLSADGSTLQFATYLNNCGVPGIALAADGSVYAGVSPLPNENATSVLHLKTVNSAAISLDQISNAFSGDASAVVAGGLYSMAISGFAPAPMNLGLNPSENLPTALTGAQVLFDGKPASILSTGPGQIIVAAPPVLASADGAENSGGATVFTSVQLVYNGVPSNAVWMPVSRVLPGLLTADFPNTAPASGYPDAHALNQDGTQNSANNPAAAGSTITLFTTGMGATAPLVDPGAIAHSPTVLPDVAIYSSWESAGPSEPAIPLAVSSIPGYVSAIFQVQIPIPADTQNLAGTDLGNGVSRVEIGLELGVNLGAINVPVSNIVAVYVK